MLNNPNNVSEITNISYFSIPQTAKILLLTVLLVVPEIPVIANQGNEKDKIEVSPINSIPEITDEEKLLIIQAVKESLSKVKTFADLPQNIVYQNHPKTHKTLPKSFDINPKKFKNPVEYIILTLGNRDFVIAPSIGKIKKIYFTETHFIIEVTGGITIKYSKDEKLPKFFCRIIESDISKGEDLGFFGVIVKEL